MRKILAIDDKKNNLTTIEAVIKSHIPDCKILTALSGKVGLKIAKEELPDIILLDIIMPEMDGYEVCKRLKEDELTKYIPVVMLTAIRTDKESRIKGLNGGADAFLTKPIDPAELSAQVNVMLRIKECENKLRADREVMEARVNERTIELSEKNKKLQLEITERKQVEQELIKAKEKAEESERLKSAFLSNISHEIRTPMNGILGFAQLLKEPNLTGDDQQEYIGFIEKSGARLLNIISDIVHIAKIESGQMEVSLSKANINTQMEEIFTFFKFEADAKEMKLLVKNTLPSEEAIIKTDHEKLHAILTKLVSNAIKFTQTGSVEFGYEKKGKYLEFFVKDTGEGICQEKKEVIFERFRQGNESHAKNYQGAGLGLSISKAYVEMLGGAIWVKSESGKGSVFYFTIPYNVNPEAEIVIKDVSSEIAAKAQNKDLRLLIVEDDKLAEMFLSIVVKIVSKEILKARTGVEAVEICRNNPDIDLVLMDINLPGMDGYEAVRQIRQFNTDVVIIAQTAYALIDDREKAIEAGCNDYISKPIDKNLLKTLIRKHCNK